MSTQFAMLLTFTAMTAYPCLSSFIEGTSKLPRSVNELSVGYDSNTDTILLVGGDPPSDRQFVTFKDHMFTDRGEQYLQDTFATRGYSQHYTQLGNELWMIQFTGTHFIKMNTETYAVTSPSITIPITVGYYGCLASFDGYLIVVGGGESESSALKITQIYRLSDSQWLSSSDVPSLNTARTVLSCVVAANTLYAIGGDDGTYTFLDSIETLDISNIDTISTQTWDDTSVQPLVSARKATRSVVYGTDIYVIGGKDNAGNRVSDVNVIDTLTGNVVVGDTLAFKTSYASSIVVGNTLYSFGGFVSDHVDTYQYSILPTFPTLNPTTNPSAYPSANIPAAQTVDPSVAPTYNPSSEAPTFNPSSNPLAISLSNFTSSNPSETSLNLRTSDGHIYIQNEIPSDGRNATINRTPSVTAMNTNNDKDKTTVTNMHRISMINIVLLASFSIVGCLCCIVICCFISERDSISKYIKKRFQTLSGERMMIDMATDNQQSSNIVLAVDERGESAMVKYWLNNVCQLETYVVTFIQNGYKSLDDMKQIKDRSELFNIGIDNVEHQTIIMNAIGQLRNEPLIVGKDGREGPGMELATNDCMQTTRQAMLSDKIVLGVVSTKRGSNGIQSEEQQEVQRPKCVQCGDILTQGISEGPLICITCKKLDSSVDDDVDMMFDVEGIHSDESGNVNIQCIATTKDAEDKVVDNVFDTQLQIANNSKSFDKEGNAMDGTHSRDVEDKSSAVITRT